MVDLDPALDRVLPAAAPERSVHRDYPARVRPGSFPVTAQIVAGLVADHDLGVGGVQDFVCGLMRPGGRLRVG